MTESKTEFERTIALGEQALDHIRAYRTSAYPHFYELWYTYASGHNTSLSRAIDALRNRSGSITQKDLEQIYDKYLSPHRFSDSFDEVGNRLTKEIDHVMATVEAAMGHANSFGDSLKAALHKLAVPATDRAALLALLDGIVRMTREAEVSNQALGARLKESRDEIRALQEGLSAVRTESLTDPLTSLSNRKAFDVTLAARIAAARETGEPLALMITDIDHFKRFNDSFGHLTGDQVLRLVALAVKQNVKGVDLAARYGGEEFAVVLPNRTLRSAVTVAEHIRRAVMSKELVKRSTGENLGRITISIGVAGFRPDDTPASIIGRADACLYAAKRGGRNRVICESDTEIQLTAIA